MVLVRRQLANGQALTTLLNHPNKLKALVNKYQNLLDEVGRVLDYIGLLPTTHSEKVNARPFSALGCPGQSSVSVTHALVRVY